MSFDTGHVGHTLCSTLSLQTIPLCFCFLANFRFSRGNNDCTNFYCCRLTEPFLGIYKNGFIDCFFGSSPSCLKHVERPLWLLCLKSKHYSAKTCVGILRSPGVLCGEGGLQMTVRLEEGWGKSRGWGLMATLLILKQHSCPFPHCTNWGSPKGCIWERGKTINEDESMLAAWEIVITASLYENQTPQDS